MIYNYLGSWICIRRGGKEESIHQIIFKGENVVQSDGLSYASEKYDQSIVVNPRTKERGKTVERIRDLKMLYKDTACLRFLGIEGQNYIDYGSAVSAAEYDIMEYRKQMKRIKTSLGNGDDKLTKSELLSGMSKDARLTPVYTIWFYYGTEPYDGPRSLSDMMRYSDDDIFRQYFSDYKINVICLNEIEDMNVFHTELRQLLKLMKCKDDAKGIKDLLEHDSDYDSVDEDTLHTLSITLNRPELWEKRALYQGKEGEVRYNMSSGIDQIEEEARQEGIQKGENLLAALINKLLSLGKNEDALKVTTDAEYGESLYIQYGLKKTI